MSTHARGGSVACLDLGQNPKYPSQTLGRWVPRANFRL